MTKLAELVSSDLSFTEKMKINVRRVGLAGVGLISIMDHERERLYKQILDMGESYGGNDTLVGRISLIGTGTLNMVREESLRVFDELVEEGEQALSKEKTPATSALDKIKTPRPVARVQAKTAQVQGKIQDKVQETAAKAKADAEGKADAVKKKAVKAVESLSDEMKQRLDKAKTISADLEDLSDTARLEIQALIKQITEGDIKGRRPAKSKPEACAEFDARRAIKGMKPAQALERLEELTLKVREKPREELAH